ncbi:L,D-transpeptidase family protein [Streptomyces sp. NPDC048193]|uniref:L,D-transpeptidase family protein n=1 Tax=unclassified Streptomyces TaxID=2593676 RepID=UPI003428E7B2
MRMRGMRSARYRSGAVACALGAVLAAGGCTVTGPGIDGTGPPAPGVGGTGPQAPGAHGPAGAPAPGANAAGRSPAAGAAPAAPPKRAPSAARRPAAAPPARPAPRVLWQRGDKGRDVRELQARLRQVGWFAGGPTGTYDDRTARAVSGFQRKRGLPRTGRTDTVTWRRLTAMTREPGRWQLYATGGQPAAAPDPRCMTGRVLCLSKSSRTLRWMVDGRTVSTMAVRFGSQYTPTREGVFHVYWKSRHHWSTIYHSPMPYAMFFSGGQAVHYSYDFAARGYAGASHGCVNVRDEAAIAALYAQVRKGDKVVVYR